MGKKNESVDSFILENLRENPKEIVQKTVDEFNISRQAVNKHIRKLTDLKKIKAEGNTKARQYSLIPISSNEFLYKNSKNLEEDIIWRDKIAPFLKDQTNNVYRTCMYCFTEICNNAINHSDADTIKGYIYVYNDLIEMGVLDNGIGIFNKIRDECKLEDPIQAIFELSKGKLTTEPESHTGEGIFFVSKICNYFMIISYKLCFSHIESSEDYLIEDQEDFQGTGVVMKVIPKEVNNMQEIFNKFSSDGGMGFTKTIVPIFLAQYGFDNLISRSQARRIVGRFEKFKTIIFDFNKVDIIGQAFADEIFRVYKNNHPNIELLYINASLKVEKMIKHVLSNP